MDNAQPSPMLMGKDHRLRMSRLPRIRPTLSLVVAAPVWGATSTGAVSLAVTAVGGIGVAVGSGKDGVAVWLVQADSNNTIKQIIL